MPEQKLHKDVPILLRGDPNKIPVVSAASTPRKIFSPVCNYISRPHESSGGDRLSVTFNFKKEAS
jgi:hypothetical protein